MKGVESAQKQARMRRKQTTSDRKISTINPPSNTPARAQTPLERRRSSSVVEKPTPPPAGQAVITHVTAITNPASPKIKT